MQRFLNHGNAERRVMEKSGKGTRCRGNPRELLAREKGESSFVDGVASDIDPDEIQRRVEVQVCYEFGIRL
jgi:hypothetical protein